MIEMRLDINITGLEGLATSILALAHGMPGNAATEKQRDDAVITPLVTKIQQDSPDPAQSAVSPAKVTTPVQAPAAPVSTPVALTQQPSAQQPVATSAPSYTLDDLALAAGTLMTPKRQPELRQLLASFGVVALPELPQERYAEFAAALREMGAQI